MGASGRRYTQDFSDEALELAGRDGVGKAAVAELANEARPQAAVAFNAAATACVTQLTRLEWPILGPP